MQQFVEGDTAVIPILRGDWGSESLSDSLQGHIAYKRQKWSSSTGLLNYKAHALKSLHYPFLAFSVSFFLIESESQRVENLKLRVSFLLKI